MRRLIVRSLAFGGTGRAGRARSRQLSGEDRAAERVRARGDRDRAATRSTPAPVATGAIFVGDLRKGTGRILVPGATTTPSTRGATGIEYDRGRLWVAGAGFGNARVYDAKTGALQQRDPVRDAARDVHQRRRRDEDGRVLHRLPAAGALPGRALEATARPGAVTTIPLTGEYAHVAGQFNLNGIVATKNGKTLIAVQSVSKKLLPIDPSTGAAKTIDIGSYDLTNGDGLLLDGEDALRRPEHGRTRSRSSGCRAT